MRAAIYTRVSSEEQASGGTSLQTQDERCRAYCTAQGWDVADVYTDAGVSGAKASRPALDAMLTAVRAGAAGAIVVAKLDRLARSMRHLTPLLGELDDAGVALVSIAETFDSSSTHGRFVRNMMGSFAELERDTIRDRTRAGIAKRVQAGGWGGGQHPPYGYRVAGAGSTAHLVVDDREADVVRTAVRLILDEGMTSGQAARQLNTLGLAPRLAPVWTTQNLRNFLNRGQFDGVWTFGKPSKRTTYHEPITLQVPPVVPAERMDALRAHLAATARPEGTQGVHPLSGRLWCPCGAYMTGVARSSRANRRYRCRWGRHEPGRPYCHEPSVLAQPVDDAVWAQMVELLADPASLTAAAREHLEVSEAAVAEGDSLADAERAVERSQRALSDAAGRVLTLGLDEETAERTLAGLRASYEGAVRHRAAVTAARATTAERGQRLTQVQQLADVARTRLAGADARLRAQVLALLDVRVTILEHPRAKGDPVRLRVEGSVLHDLLLTASESDWTPDVRASAGA